MNSEGNEAVAIIGMAGRFPGASSLDGLWKQFASGASCISTFEPGQLEHCAADSDPENAARYVRSRSVLENEFDFDGGFFGIYPKQAELMDPQHRVFLECAWEALESAGYDPEGYKGLIGLYAGLSLNTYLLYNLASAPGFAPEFAASYPIGSYDTLFGNDKDFLTTRVAHKLNLTGPCVTVQTACSTSLVAVVQAYYSLLTYQCDMALAGGVSITFPQRRDYLYQPDGMVSRDGTCRSFDAEASGTVFGSGAGLVVLKRLSDALRDGDHVRAIILGGAVNNDGSARAGYAAPGVAGQAAVIAMAHDVAGVNPESISYIEAHGTGTPIGDPIEVAGLTQAFRRRTSRAGFCALGTAKTNLGHLDMAAGVAGLIKTVLQLEKGYIAPLANFRSPNPRIDFSSTPFFPVSKLTEWARTDVPRRAGVSAFGVGGTNAHLIVEEAPLRPASSPGRRLNLLVISARSQPALAAAAANLASHLEGHPGLSLADVAFTLQSGRRAFDHRLAVVAADAAEAVEKLGRFKAEAQGSVPGPSQPPPRVAFLFPGQGTQFPDMGLELYRTEAVFRAEVDRCAALFERHLGVDLRTVLYPVLHPGRTAVLGLGETVMSQPAIFVTELAVARLWESWGVRPSILIGHSIGEYVCAVLSGALTLEDAIRLLSSRAQLMQRLPGGSMLAIRRSAEEVRPLLPPGVEIAAENSRLSCTVSGSAAAVAAFFRTLEAGGIAAKELETSHAFHSAMMEPMLAEFGEVAAATDFRPPAVPWISTCTGRAIGPEDVSDRSYWVRQVRQPVLLEAALGSVVGDPSTLLLEVGPGQVLSQFARQHPARLPGVAVLSSMSAGKSGAGDLEPLLSALGGLWTRGARVNWQLFQPAGSVRHRVPLPTYPFERKRHCVSPTAPCAEASRKPEASCLPATSDPIQALPTVMSPEPKKPAVVGSRLARLAAELQKSLHDLSGISDSDFPVDATFAELGLDSLFLTQAAQMVQKRFGTKVTFRQMMEELSSVSAVARHLEAVLPPEVESAAPAAEAPSSQSVVQSPAASFAQQPNAGPASGTAFERLVAQQMALMQQQLEIFRQGGAAVTGGGTTAGSNPVAAAPRPAAAGAKPAARSGDGDLKRFGPFKGVEIGPKGGLTPRQEKGLSALVERYNRRTAGSKAYAQKHRAHFCDPRAAGNFKLQWKEMVYPIVCSRSAGARLWDIDGNEYIDVTLGFGANYFGHSPDFVVKAVADQLQKGFEIGPQSPLAGEAAEMLCRMTRMERATFCNTGSEAVMAAMRVARTVSGRDKVVYFSGDYHGIFDEVLARAATVDGVPGALPIAPGIPPLPNMVVLEYGNPASLEQIRAMSGEIAGVIVEPVQSRHPDLQPREFLRELRVITREADIALIFDEVVTGFRAAPGGAQEYFGVEADLATYGKVIGGGMPIGVLAGKRKYMDALDGGMWSFGDNSYPEIGVTFFAGTFVRHPLVMAAVHATLKHLEQAGAELQRTTTEKTAKFVRRLNEYFTSAGVPIRLQTFGSVFYYDFHPDLKFASLLFYHLRDRGVHIWEGRVGQICTAHTEQDLDQLFNAFKSSTEEMQAAGFLPVPEPGPGPGSGVVHDDGGPVALTEGQRELWISCQMGEDANCAYNESCSLILTGSLNVPRLVEAAGLLLDRHDSLRGRFSASGDHQEFPARQGLEVPVRDLSSLSPEQRVRQAQALVAADMATPFDLVAGPVVRMQILRMAADEHHFVFTTHHAFCDGWSFGVVFHELAQIYSSLCEGKPHLLEPAMQFRDYALWSAREQSGAAVRASEEFWMRKFEGGGIPVLDLPYDRPRPPLKTYNGSFAVHRCDPEVFASLKKASGQMGNTLFGTLFSAFYVLIHRLSGQEDIVVGIPAAGQTLVESNDLIGHCLNFLPMRRTIDSRAPFAGFAGVVKKEVLDAYDHQNYTYGTLVQRLKLDRDPSRLPLLSVMFNIDKRGLDKLRFSGVDARLRTNAKRFVNFDLFLNLMQGDKELDLECEYNTDLFDHETVMRWLGHFETMMRSIAANPNQPISGLALLSDAERAQMISGGNQTLRPIPAGLTVHGLFQAQVAATPGATAVEDDNRSLTYRELDRLAGGVAARLSSLSAGPGRLVALFLERSVDIAVGALGILKSGAAYLPLDPMYPAERLAFYISDSEAPVVVTQRSLVQSLPASAAKVVCIEDLCAEPCGGTPVVSADPESLAYVIYTSGSTGKPKGVQVHHRAVVNFLCSMRREPGLQPTDVLLAVTTLSFDIAGLEIFLPLVSGARVIIASRETASDGNQLKKEIERRRVTVMQATPITWSMLVESGWSGTPGLKALCGGEAVTRELANELVRRCSEAWNMYGPTETTIWSTVCRLRQEEGPVSIGFPIDNTLAYIVDEGMQLSPPGVPGELLIGGDGVARGYLKRPELTAEKFLPDPFTQRTGARVYRTGDLVRRRADGSLECLGRIDNQVKLRGFRIELGEIESVLRSHPLVREAVVAVREDNPGQRRLVGYVTVRTDPGAKSATNGSDPLASQWRDQWESTFSSALAEAKGHKDGIQNIDSIINSWTGLQDSAAHTAEWIDVTVRRLQEQGARRVLEVGCGTGQLLLRLAPGTEAYWGTDFAKAAIDGLEVETRGRGLKNVRLMNRSADSFEGIPDASFDLFLLHSVSQYFPDPAYLLRVLEGGAKTVSPGGRMFIGDVQSHSLLECFHAATQVKAAPGDQTVGQVRARVHQRVSEEAELVVDPDYFEQVARRIPGVKAVDVQLRRGRLVNETTQYHYDVILHIGSSPKLIQVGEWLDWGTAGLSLSTLRQRLAAAGRDIVLGLRNVPNRRLLRDVRLAAALKGATASDTIAACRDRVPEDGAGVDPEDLWVMADELGLHLDLRWSGSGADGGMDCVFSTSKDRTASCVTVFGPPPAAVVDCDSFANNPSRNLVLASLPQALRKHVQPRLPDYMVPSTVVVLDSLPLTPNGKVNRKGLAAPLADAKSDRREFVSPRNEKEKALAEIWMQVLGLEKVSVEDNFFDVGGDSLLSFRVANRASQAGLTLTPRMFFQHKTIADLVKAADVSQPAAQGAAAPAAITRVSRDAHRRKLSGN